MKKNLLYAAAIVVVGAGIFALNDLRAQNQPVAPAAPAPARQPGGPPGSRPFPTRGGRMVGMYHQTIRMLTMIKGDLDRSKEDYNGHRQSALDACNKAIEELQAVQNAMMAEMKSQPPQGNPPQSAPAPNAAPAPATPPSH